nr:MAG TPA: hypothetical protein [Caudoviricetes sp.]
MFDSSGKKFKVGDIITGIDGSPYTVTNSRGTFKVIYVYDDEFVRVRIVKHIDPLKVGSEFDVLSKYFVYAKDFVHWEGIFNKAYNQKAFDIKDGVPVVDGVSVDSPCYKQLCAEYAKYKKSAEKER